MEQPLTIALFIDADNLSNAHLAIILHKLNQYGTVTIRRAYGNWASPALGNWKEKLHQFAIKPIQQFDLTKGKNATDIALTIDVMDCLHTKAIDIFVIAASDCDYTPLVMRLKEENKTVLGFGEPKSPQSYIDSFSQFIELNSKQNQDLELLQSTPTELEKQKALAKRFIEHLGLAELQPIPPSPQHAPKPANNKLNTLLKNAVEQNKTAKGWASLSAVGKSLSQQQAFNVKDHGAKKLSALIRSLGQFELAQRHDGLWVKTKP